MLSNCQAFPALGDETYVWCNFVLLRQGPGTQADGTDGAALHKRMRVFEPHATRMHIDLDAIHSAWSLRKPAATSEHDETRHFNAASLKVWVIRRQFRLEVESRMQDQR